MGVWFFIGFFFWVVLCGKYLDSGDKDFYKCDCRSEGGKCGLAFVLERCFLFFFVVWVFCFFWLVMGYCVGWFLLLVCGLWVVVFLWLLLCVFGFSAFVVVFWLFWWVKCFFGFCVDFFCVCLFMWVFWGVCFFVFGFGLCCLVFCCFFCVFWSVLLVACFCVEWVFFYFECGCGSMVVFLVDLLWWCVFFVVVFWDGRFFVSGACVGFGKSCLVCCFVVGCLFFGFCMFCFCCFFFLCFVGVCVLVLFGVFWFAWMFRGRFILMWFCGFVFFFLWLLLFWVVFGVGCGGGGVLGLCFVCFVCCCLLVVGFFFFCFFLVGCWHRCAFDHVGSWLSYEDVKSRDNWLPFLG